MARGVRWYVVGTLVLVALAGCGRGLFEQREPWRHEAEVACLQSGAVREGAGIIRMGPINGPGACGADFPFKVATLGESSAYGFADEPRPPGSIPHGASVRGTPRWPVTPQRQAPTVDPRYRPEPYDVPEPRAAAVAQPGAPLSITPPGLVHSGGQEPPPHYSERSRSPAYGSPQPRYPQAPPVHGYPRTIERAPIDAFPAEPRTYGAPRAYPAGPPMSEPPILGRGRGAPVTGAIGPASVKPAATLACPLVSALDQWITTDVQPAAMRWFGQPVAEIRQISAYSCRGMNGNPHARISEHAFGNALDIAAFTLTDGRRVTVKDGWRGLPEEQGFLRDVQAAACERFHTVLAPGSNAFHYDHFHVDLMRRSSGRRICEPGPVSGDEVAARAARRNGNYARHGDPTVTGSLGSRRSRVPARHAVPGDDDWIEDDGPRPRPYD
jgi:hypothetical protein